MDKPVPLTDMLNARERRALGQRALPEAVWIAIDLLHYEYCGGGKNSPLIQRGFNLGVGRLREERRLTGLAERHFEDIREFAGNEAFPALNEKIKPCRFRRLKARERHRAFAQADHGSFSLCRCVFLLVRCD